MSDFTTRGFAKRRAAQKQMIAETTANMRQDKQAEEEASARAITESGEKHFQFATAKTKSTRLKSKAAKEFSNVVTECVQQVLSETVYQGIPASEDEKAPYKSGIMTELTEFFTSPVCDYTGESHFIKAVSEEVSVLISEGFDATGTHNDNFKAYSLATITEAMEDNSTVLSSIVEEYASMIEQRTLGAILAAQRQATSLSEALELRVSTLSEAAANDEHLTKLALAKVHAKVKPTLFESVFTFIKRRLPEGNTATNDEVMQEAACFTSMLEAAHLTGVSSPTNMNDFLNKLCSDKVVLEDTEVLDEASILNNLTAFVDKLYTGYSADEVKEIKKLYLDINTEKEAVDAVKKLDKMIADIEKDNDSSNTTKMLKSGLLGIQLRKSLEKDRNEALKFLKLTSKTLKSKYKLK